MSEDMKMKSFLTTSSCRTVLAAFGLATFGLAAALVPVISQAQTSGDSWQWQGTVYAWLPGMDLETELPSGGTGPTIDVDASTLVDNLDFTFMGTLQGRRGDWGFFTDVIYLNEGASGTLQREVNIGGNPAPADVELDLNLDLKSWVWTVAGTYSLSASDRHNLDLVAGTRMLDIDETFEWSFTGNIEGTELPGREGAFSASGTNWDAIVGLKGNAFLGADSHWFIPWYADVGAGDSDLTWQAMTGLGYQFGWGTTSLTWRYLTYDMGSGGAITDLTMSGPMLGATFRW